jgi:multicomponent Na+:H+ antiporter subunit E
MKLCKGSVILFFMLWGFWVFLSGFDYQEVILGAAVAAVVSVSMGRGYFREPKLNYIKRFIFLIIYVPFYVWEEVKAHAEVITSIITGRISPEIVEVKHAFQHSWGITALANSITMTPGTLSLEAEPGRVFVHCLNGKKDKNSIVSSFERHLKRIWD